jgi:Ni,Fe-hydrogenase III small subunit/formate hydrogenlyase subunit 6/NADH:ubiquinone oxidoreductase subunit I
MFRILTKTAQTGLVTIGYPDAPPAITEAYRGAPKFDFARWRDVLPAAAACPTGAIAVRDEAETREVTVDYGLCIYCGECAAADTTGAVQTTGQFELAVQRRSNLVIRAQYGVTTDGVQGALRTVETGEGYREQTTEKMEARLRRRIHEVLGRSLAIREVDAGSCNGCEVEVTALNNPLYDVERLGIHFVASPRHADMLLVSGPVTRNMELALVKAYRATPDPKLVVAIGACGISGGIFGRNYATLGGVDSTIPVDVYVPGCPPRPQALLYGILLAVGRLEERGLPK